MRARSQSIKGWCPEGGGENGTGEQKAGQSLEWVQGVWFDVNAVETTDLGLSRAMATVWQEVLLSGCAHKHGMGGACELRSALGAYRAM